MNQEELRKHRCCFTGHRPSKMNMTANEIKPLLEKAIDDAIAEGYVTFITGMAEGTDIWQRKLYSTGNWQIGIYTLYVPCLTRDLKADEAWRKRKGLITYSQMQTSSKWSMSIILQAATKFATNGW